MLTYIAIKVAAGTKLQRLPTSWDGCGKLQLYIVMRQWKWLLYTIYRLHGYLAFIRWLATLIFECTYSKIGKMTSAQQWLSISSLVKYYDLIFWRRLDNSLLNRKQALENFILKGQLHYKTLIHVGQVSRWVCAVLNIYLSIYSNLNNKVI